MLDVGKLKRGMFLFCATPRYGYTNIARVIRVNKRSVRVQPLLDDFTTPGQQHETARVTWSMRDTVLRWWSTKPGKRWRQYRSAVFSERCGRWRG